VSIIQRPVGAALAIALGAVALFVSASLLMLRDGSWPWHASITAPVGAGAATAEILDADGTAYRFTGSSTDAQNWLDNEQQRLKEAHGIPAKIAVGRVLQPVGLVLVLLGVARLLWQLATVRRAPSVSTPPERWPDSPQ
jgi:hypothetical protein